MAGSTPVYGFPYPESSDLVANYPALGEQLAEDIEAELVALDVIYPNAAWLTFTPTISGTGWALGNATAAGIYVKQGKVIHFNLILVFGSTSTYGAGNLSVNLPVAALSTGSTRVNHIARYSDDSAGQTFAGMGAVTSTTAVEMRYVSSGLMVNIINTVPFTWGTGDALRMNGTYQSA
jgi:hypothetical protein